MRRRPPQAHLLRTHRPQLETDPSILIPKARGALERYGHQIVVGNLLDTRKHEVVFVRREGEEWLRIPADAADKGSRGEVVKEIEEDIIEHLVTLHDRYVEGAGV